MPQPLATHSLARRLMPKKPGRRGPKPGTGGRPRGSTKPPNPAARVILSCRVAPETLAALRSAGPKLGEAIDRLVSGK